MTTPPSRLARSLDRADVSCPQCGFNLRQNISGRCPECGSKLALQVVAVGVPSRRPITGALAYIRVGLILIALTTVSVAFAGFLSAVLSGDDAQITNILLVTFGVGTVLGAAAFGSLFLARRIHFVVSILFFGLTTFIMTVNIVSEILAGTTYASLATAVAQYASMFGILLVGIAGMIIEVICDQRLRAGSQIAFAASEPESLSDDPAELTKEPETMKDDEKLLDEATKRIRDAITKCIRDTHWHCKQRQWVDELEGQLRRECDRYVAGKKNHARICRTDELLQKASEAVDYDLKMMHAMLQRQVGTDSPTEDQAVANAMLHSCLLAARNLCKFLYSHKPQDDDIVAEDFFDNPDNWKNLRPPSQAEFEKGSLAGIISRRLLHLTYERAKRVKQAKGKKLNHRA